MMRGLWDKEKKITFPFSIFFFLRERRKKRKRASKLLSLILEVSSVEIRRAKRESLSTRRGLYIHTKKMRNFTEDSKDEISRNQRFWAKEASYPCYYASRCGNSSCFGLFPP